MRKNENLVHRFVEVPLDGQRPLPMKFPVPEVDKGEEHCGKAAESTDRTWVNEKKLRFLKLIQGKSGLIRIPDWDFYLIESK
ncbi:hypothetical protein FTW19_17820 [Terriglobus albidus]|uniref:Uncharacterized protein n=1 Tax=Terriglobus albidus TaxID=1592106 RepID=A0A5B9EFY1_9BACT|nr:hypothetical protein [Terriglobus albidus]QEE29680.1 hypothetical protein FTW19_17820 [Terriglobus albidus]